MIQDTGRVSTVHLLISGQQPFVKCASSTVELTAIMDSAITMVARMNRERAVETIFVSHTIVALLMQYGNG